MRNRYESIFKEAREKFPEFAKSGVDVVDVIAHLFATLRFYIEHDTAPRISLRHFGTFFPTRGKLSKALHYRIWAIRKGKLDEEEGRATIKHYWKIYKRLVAERADPNHVVPTGKDHPLYTPDYQVKK